MAQKKGKKQKVNKQKVGMNRLRTIYNCVDKEKYNTEYIHYVIKRISQSTRMSVQYLLVQILECGLNNHEEFSTYYQDLREEYVKTKSK